MVSSPQHEPTMEEILASIRKIISEDSTEGQPAAEPKQAAPASIEPLDTDSDVLELTQEIPEEAPAAAPAPAPEPEPMIAAAPLPPPENDVVFEPIEPEPAPVAAEAAASSDGGIFSDKTRKAVDDAFAAIDEPEEDNYAVSRPTRSVSVDGLSVEAVFERAVRDAFEPVTNKWLGDNTDDLLDRMKPLIREWMDEHFPALLEGAVRDEVARVARARGSKR